MSFLFNMDAVSKSISAFYATCGKGKQATRGPPFRASF